MGKNVRVRLYLDPSSEKRAEDTLQKVVGFILRLNHKAGNKRDIVKGTSEAQ